MPGRDAGYWLVIAGRYIGTSVFLIGIWYIGFPLAIMFVGFMFLIVRPAILRSMLLQHGRQTWGRVSKITFFSESDDDHMVSGYRYRCEFEVIREGQRPVTMVCYSTRLRSCQVGDRVLIHYLESDPEIAIALVPPKQS